MIMLYSYNETLKIILRIYEYLQMRMKEQPRTLKMNKPLHRSAVVSFMETLPPTAGADFIWNFLLFQFYVFVGQDHERKPMPSWFMGKEAWRRWNEYSDEAKWHARDWAREKKLVNPVKTNTYEAVSDDVFRRERLRMSRISGPNFCEAKFGSSPYNHKDEICYTCPFEKDCKMLFGTKDSSGKSLYEQISESAEKKSATETQQLQGSHVTIREVSRMTDYGEDD